MDHSQAKKRVLISFGGTHPMIGDYSIKREGDYQMIAPSQFKLSWTGISRFSSGKLATLSPIYTNMEFTMGTVTPSLEVMEDVSVLKRMGLILTIDKFFFITNKR